MAPCPALLPRPRTWRLATLLAALPLALIPAGRAHAQCQLRPDGTYWCEEGSSPGGDNLPSVAVSPPALRTTQPAGLPVTVSGVDDLGVVDSTFRVYVNGVDVTSTFSYAKTGYASGPVRVRFTATGTVRLSETGPTEVQARICDTAHQCVQAEDPARYVLVLPGVSVTPDGEGAIAAAGPAAHTFQVRNTGTEPAAFQLAAACRDLQTGLAVSCTAPPSTAEVAPGAAAAVQVSWTAAAGQEVAVSLSARQADAAGVQDAGWVDVAGYGAPGATRAAPQVAVVSLQSSGPLDRGDCVAVAVAVRAAYECGDLRLAHGLPAHRTRGRTWAPALLFNSRHAYPRPTVYADVSFPAGSATPAYLEVLLALAGGPTYSAGIEGGAFSPGMTRRIGVQWDDLYRSTGLYRYTLTVTAVYSTPTGTVRSAAVRDSGEIAIVNRSQSPFGAGWWWAGWEQIVCVTCNTPGAPPRMLWISGDGSTQVFEPLQTWSSWIARNPDGAPDTLYSVTEGGVSFYRRRLKGGGEINLDGGGRHFRTLNRLGQVTWFDQADGRLNGVYVPNTGNGIAPAWLLGYDGAGRLSTVNAASQGAAERIVTVSNTGGRVTGITDPDGLGVTYGYDAQRPDLVAQHTDRRGGRTSFVYDAPGRLSSARTWLGTAPNDSVDAVTRFEAAESRGVVAVGTTGFSTARAHAWTRMDGPRTDAVDVTWLHLDGQGRVRRAVNPLGQATVARRTDTRFPALVTETVDPAGLVTTAAYDSIGRIRSTTAVDPYGNGWNATAEYTWDDRWHQPKTVKTFGDSATVRRQIGGTAHTEYDAATGSPTVQRTGDDDARRVRYRYYPAGHPHAGQLRAVEGPAAGGGTAVDSLVYDGVGNLSMTVSPHGFLTLHVRDGLGRDTLVITPIDSATATTPQNLLATGARQRIGYDVMDRVRRTESIGPPRTHAAVFEGFAPAPTPEERLEVITTYDGEGAPLTVARFATPDHGGGGMVTEYRYDPAGRMVSDSSTQSGVQRFQHDQAGNVVVARTAAGFEVRSRYDALGRLTRRGVPERTYARACDDVLLNRDDCEWFPRFPNFGTGYRVPEEWHHYRYDAAGRQAYAENADAIVTRTWHRGGALRTDSTWIRAAEGATYAAYGLRYAYDPGGRLAALEHPRNLTGTSVRPDSFYYHPVTGALSRGVSRLGHGFDFHHANDGALIRIRMPGAVVDTMSYDREGRLAWRRETGPEGILQAETLRYDARGKRVHVENEESAFHNWYSGLGTLAGNDWYNLTRNVARIAEELQTDPLGNTPFRRTSVGRDATTGEFPRFQNVYETATGRLIAMRRLPPASPGTDFVQDSTVRRFDGGGNVHHTYQRVARPAEGGVEPGREVETRSYYGADDRLRVLQKMDVRRTTWTNHEDAGVWEEYRYDALGRRVLVRTRTDGGLCTYDAWACTASTTTFVWAGDQLLWELKSAGGTYASTAGGNVSYFHAGGIDRPLVITKNGESIVPHQNWRGQFARGTYADGANAGKSSDCTAYPASGCTPIQWPGERTTAYHELEPQGEIRNWFGGLVDDMRDASGQMYRRNRYYEPQTGQFTQPDPIGLAGGLNAYGFAEGDPVTYGDPYGLCPPISLCLHNILASNYKLGDMLHAGRHAFLSMLQQATGRNVNYHQLVLAATGIITREANRLTAARASMGFSADQQNAFRHIYGSCELTRMFGEREARETTYAHERTLHERDAAEVADAKADQKNNNTGIAAASRSNLNHWSCEEIADENIRVGNFWSDQDFL